jgi:hypothetical protein
MNESKRPFLDEKRVTEESHRAATTVRFSIWLSELMEICRLKLPGKAIYSREAIVRRLSQKICEVSYHAFCRESVSQFRRGTMNSWDHHKNSYGGVSIDATVSVATKVYLKALVEGFSYFGFVQGQFLLSSLKSVFCKNPLGSAVILANIGESALSLDGTDRELVQFCKEGPISSLVHAKMILVQSDKYHSNTSPTELKFSKWPIFTLVSENRFSLKHFFSFQLEFFRSLLVYAYLCTRTPLAVFLGRDYAFHSIFQNLSDRKLIQDYFLSNGNVAAQFLWLNDTPNRSFGSHMIWYSMNVRWHVYHSDPVEWFDPSNHFILVDEHWLWIESFKEWFKDNKIVVKKFHVVGPLLWNLKTKNLRAEEKLQSSPLVISLFDVSPVTKKYEEELGFLAHYYTYELAVRFIQKVLEVSQEFSQSTGRQVVVNLKHKRSASRVHELGYFELIRELEKTYSFLKVLPFQTKIFDLAEISDLFISVPFSSPNYVMVGSGKPGIYFDPTMSIRGPKFPEDDIFFCSGEHELKVFLKKHFSPSF